MRLKKLYLLAACEPPKAVIMAACEPREAVLAVSDPEGAVITGSL